MGENMEEFKYTIGDKVYKQTPLVLGQIQQLTNLIQGLILPEDTNVISLISVLGDKLPTAIAIVLKPSDVALRDKDIEVITKEISFELSPEQTIQVIEDFFDCNQISSLLTKITATLEKIKGNLGTQEKETGLQN